MNDSKRYELLKATGELPSPRGIALAIIRLTQADSTSLIELAHAIKGDPAFAGRLVKAANGAVSLRQRTVISVQDALMVLGLPAVRTMALGFTLLSDYRQGVCKAFDYVRFWSRSVLLALAMQQLALRTQVLGPDDAFSLGLLARVGELALATLYPAEFAEVLRGCCQQSICTQLECEHATLAITRTELSEAMLLDWGVPQLFAGPVRYFQTPEVASYAESSRDAAIMLLLEISSVLADLCLAAEGEVEAVQAVLAQRAAALGLAQGDLSGAAHVVQESWEEWRELLQLDSAPDSSASAVRALEQAAEPSPVPAAAEHRDEDRATATAQKIFTVLVVCEDSEERSYLRGALEANDFVVVEEARLEHIVERVIELQPQLAIVDWDNSVRQAERMRALRKTRCGMGLYLLALLDDGDETSVRAAIDADVDDFLPRPLRSSVLMVRAEVGRRLASLQRQLQREGEELRQQTVKLTISNRRLVEVAMTDVLTSLPNRRYAVERIQSEWSAAVCYRHPLSVMVVDLDNFKDINDSYGHDAGDMALRQVADVLRGGVRAQDVVCRTGGDEFLVICPGSDLEAAVSCAERLRHAVEALEVEAGGHEVRVSLSIGVAVREEEMSGADALIKLADRGSFAAKRLGRNQVFVPQLGSGEG